jgi:hypothetical protein
MADISSFSSQCQYGFIRDTLHAGTRQAINNTLPTALHLQP